MDNNKLTFKTDTGEELIFDIVAIVTNKIGSRNIVYFTDNKVDENGNTLVYPAFFVMDNDQIRINNDMSEEDFDDLKKGFEMLMNHGNNTNVSTNPYSDLEVL